MQNKEFIKKDTTNDTVILFIHGILEGPDHFDFFLSSIPESYAVYNILLDGHGKTLKDFHRSSMKKWKSQTDDLIYSLTKSYKNIIIVAHSMGTLFAIEYALKYNSHIKALFLLAVPLKVQISFSAVKNALKVVFKKYQNDELALAFRNSCSITMTCNPIDYIRCVPRYLELFAEIRHAKKSITRINLPVWVFQSARDELVSAKSEKYIRKNKKINLSILENSRHFLYNKEDMEFLLDNFRKLL